MKTGLIIAMLFFSTASVAQDFERPPLRCTWIPPIIGSPVAAYVVEMWSIDDSTRVWVGATQYLAITIPDTVVTPDGEYYARVSGIDRHGRQGPWSESLDYYWDTGSPGSPLDLAWELEE